MDDQSSEPHFTTLPGTISAALPTLSDLPAEETPTDAAPIESVAVEPVEYEPIANVTEDAPAQPAAVPETFTLDTSAMKMGLVAVVFLVIGFIAGALIIGSRSISAADVESMVRAIVSEQLSTVNFSGGTEASALVDNDPSFGPADAPITIVEFSDFYCPHCETFATETLPQLQAQYGDKIRFVYRDLPIIGGQYSLNAAIAGNCANDQGKFWDYHNILFANPSARERDTYVSFAGEMGMDAEAFRTCLDDQAKLDEVTLDWVDGNGLGIQGTPAFFINGKVVNGSLPFSTFALVINQELEKLGIETPASTVPEPTPTIDSLPEG